LPTPGTPVMPNLNVSCVGAGNMANISCDKVWCSGLKDSVKVMALLKMALSPRKMPSQ